MINKKNQKNEQKDEIMSDKGQGFGEQKKKEIFENLNDRKDNLAAFDEELIKDYLMVCNKTYEKLARMGDTPQLQECKKNAKQYIESILDADIDIDNNEISRIRQLSKGERFLFGSKFGKHFKMELGEFKDINRINKKELETVTNINNIKKGDRFMRLHRDIGVDLSEMTEILYKMKVFLDTYKPKEKIRYCIALGRLQNSEFIEYFRKRLQENQKDKTSNIIKVYDETRNYLAKQGRLANTPIEGDYNEFKEQYIIKDKDPKQPSSLNQALAAYEKEGKRMKEGCMIIDLDKVQKMMLYNR